MEKIDFDFSRFTYITIGRLDIGKNHKMMIDSFSKIKDKNSQLIIIGYGELEDKLNQYIEYLDLENRVFLVGRQENPYKWLHHSDCFLFTSLHEGFPNVILEALACNLSIISTDPNGVVGEILEKKFGTIIKTEEELTKNMENIVVIDNVKQRAEEFKLDSILPIYLKVID
jgi:N-acetylgalactosamine-N,N'-diacetylbacillosaminyl-diphospho-undecaprenol 4-alpha-N-acetylgalactosaminyltransferase